MKKRKSIAIVIVLAFIGAIVFFIKAVNDSLKF